MTITQITIFIENRQGTLKRVLDILKKSGIQLITTTIADTEDYGLFRIICDDPDRAMKALRDASVPAVLSDVFALKLEDRPGCAADTISIFTEEGISINYLYSFILDGSGIMVFNTDTPALAREVISRHNLRTLNQ